MQRIRNNQKFWNQKRPLEESGTCIYFSWVLNEIGNVKMREKNSREGKRELLGQGIFSVNIAPLLLHFLSILPGFTI